MIFLQRGEAGASLTYVGDAARILKQGVVIADWAAGGSIENIPEGDGYVLEVRTGGVVTTEPLAVGIVVWTLGQSNMKGWYSTPSLATSDAANAYAFDDGGWQPLAGAGAVAFANSLSASEGGVPVAFVNGAVNGSALLADNEGGFGYWENGPKSLYTDALQTLASAGGKAEFVLWSQGEADAGGTSAAAYQAALAPLFSRVLDDLPLSDIIIVGLGPTRISGQESGYRAIRQGQADTAAALPHTHYLPSDTDLELADGPHLSGASYAWQAREAAALAAWLRGGANDVPEEMLGGSDADLVTGTARGDMIATQDGADGVSGAAGDDLIRGGAGDDLLLGDDGDDLISGGDGNDVVLGGDDNDEIFGDTGDDVLDGGAGNDLLFGGDGQNRLIGGLGDDMFVATLADTIVEEALGGIDTVQVGADYVLGDHLENLVLVSTAVSGTGNALDNQLTGNTSANHLRGHEGNDRLWGGEGSDLLEGGAGDDTLDGASGADRMTGGAGNDSYVVDHAGDVVVELDGEGRDTLKTSLGSYILPDFVEDLSFAGSGGLNATGNALANLVRGGGASDSLFGGAGDDELSGQIGNDVLDGGLGADTMIGGAGNDTFYVDSTKDVVTELAGGGADAVFATATFTLTAEVESLTLLGAEAIGGTGNALANRITGAEGANILIGLAGADMLNGGAGDDRLDGGRDNDTMIGGAGSDTFVVDSSGDIVSESSGGGIDTVITTLASYTLGGAVENLSYGGSDTLSFKGNGNAAANMVNGGAGNDVLNTYAGADILDGGAGADTMTGGTENDIYYVDHAQDKVVEYGTGGVDMIRTTLNTYTIAKSVERAEFIGTGAFTATGLTGAETLVGGAGSDRLDGVSGNDVLIGLGGNDALIGGSGTDIAAYGTSVVNHQLVRAGTIVTLKDLAGADGTDTLSSIEKLQFLEGQFSATANNAPLAQADAFEATSGKATVLAVLANDWDLESGRTGLSVTIVSGPAKGSLRFNSDGTAVYTSSAGYTGSDQFTYRVSDGTLTSAITQVTLDVQKPANALPVATWASLVEVPEHTSAVTLLTATDADAGDTLTFRIAGGADADLFRLSGQRLEFMASPDFESDHAPDRQVIVEVSDGKDAVLKPMIVRVTDVNDRAPLIISPAIVTVPENERRVLDLMASDADTTGEPITFSIKARTGDATRFRLDGNTLEFINPVDYEAEHGEIYRVTIIASDGVNSSEQTIAVEVIDVLEIVDLPPTDILLSHARVSPGAEAGTVVGTLIGLDPDGADGLTFTLIDDAGGLFALEGETLVLAGEMGTGSAASYSVVVRLTDAGRNSIERSFTVAVAADEPPPEEEPLPPSFVLTSAQIDESAAIGAIVGSLGAADPAGATLSLVENGGGRFRLAGGQLIVAGPLDYESATSHQVLIRITDGAGRSADHAFTISVGDVNDNAPVFGSPAFYEVAENTSEVAILSASDADNVGGPITFAIDPAVGDAALFTLSGSTLSFRSAPDFESTGARPYSLTLRLSDGVHEVRQTISVSVSDVMESKVHRGTAGDDRFTLSALPDYDIIDGLGGSDLLVATGNTALVGAQGPAFTLDLARNGTIDITAISVERLELSGQTLAFSGSVAATALAAGGVAFRGTAGADTLDGSLGAVALLLEGAAGADQLKGGTATDVLDGGAGNDVMSGGLGDDFYRVDSVGDTVVEAVGGGDDIVLTSLARFLLGSNLEDLAYDGALAFTGTGNALDNTLTGGAGADTLDGLGGADRMIGGAGNDTYIVDSTGDLAVEDAAMGSDHVKATASHTLGANVEKLTLTGKAQLDGSGNIHDNVLTGNAGNNWLTGLAGSDSLYGGTGDDVLNGGAGADAMTGNAGADRFVFDVIEVKANKDTIKDFEKGVDTIALDADVFSAVASTAAGTLDPAQFVIGGLPTNGSSRILYNTSSGAIYYDPDGTGSSPSLLIATLSSKPVLGAGDFLLI